MFDYTKTFLEQSTNTTFTRKKIVLLYCKDSEASIISDNFAGDVNNAKLFFLSNKENIYEDDESIFVKLKSQKPTKSDVWASMAEVYDRYNKKDVVLILTGKFSYDCVYALVIRSYEYSFLKSKSSSTAKARKIQLYSPENEKAFTVANAQNFARFLGDTPSNHMTPGILSDYYLDYFKGISDIQTEVFDDKYLKEKGYNLILAVGKGSAESPKLFHAKYMGRDSTDIDVALVGKGVTFDTGGISIKPSDQMFKQKQDMMGSAICAAVLKLLSIMKVKVNVSLTLPLVENCPGSNAVKPGDVIISESGLSIEVDNTDAEGRLILADANTFAQKDEVKYLFNVATLTGAVRIALGNVFGGYFTPEKDLDTIIQESSNKTGDLLWRLPLHSGYASSLETEVADLCNMSRSKKGAGGSVAAEFIRKFVKDGIKWAHFDISNVKNDHYISEIFGNHTTGRPIPALYEVICEIAQTIK